MQTSRRLYFFRFPEPRVFRKKTNWLTALVVEIFAPVLRGYARWRTGAGSMHPSQWKRALIVGDNHIGDLLYRTCSLEALKQGLPGCDFYYLAAPATAEILDDNPALKQVLPWARSDSPLDLSSEHYSALRTLQFDALLSTNCIKYWPELMLGVRLGIPHRVGYIYKGFSGWVTHPIALNYPLPFPAYFRDYVAQLTGQKQEWPLLPRIFPSAADSASAEEAWRRHGLTAGKPVVACFVTTRQQTGVWPAENFARALSLIRRQSGVQIVLCGAGNDKPLLEKINADFELHAAVLAGELNLKALFCFLKRCRAVLCADSGPRHIANAAKVPVFFIRNPWFCSTEAGRYADTEEDLAPPEGELLDIGHQKTFLHAILPEHVAVKVMNSISTC